MKDRYWKWIALSLIALILLSLVGILLLTLLHWIIGGAVIGLTAYTTMRVVHRFDHHVRRWIHATCRMARRAAWSA